MVVASNEEILEGESSIVSGDSNFDCPSSSSGAKCNGNQKEGSRKYGANSQRNSDRPSENDFPRFFQNLPKDVAV